LAQPARDRFGRRTRRRSFPTGRARLSAAESAAPGLEKLPRYVPGDPGARPAVAVDVWREGVDNTRSQRVASLPDLPERPAGSLPDVGSIVVRCSHESREQVGENAVVCTLVVHSADCYEDECGALDELLGSSRPFDRLRERERGTREQVVT